MRSSSLLALTALSSFATLLSQVPDARACGGCFHGSNESTPSVVTGHRMALSVSPTRTVLWDQVQYAGDPKDFAWVLPVGPGAYIEEASPAFFESLEAVTATHIMSPTVTCSNGQVIRQNENSFSCGGSAAAPVDTAGGGDTEHQVRDQGNVTVEHEGTVGPYETVTLKSDDPNALSTWLTSHGYAIPDDIKPVISAYVKEKSEFIALRLKPDAGVREMTPVRVITPGAAPNLPLRMVAAGTGAEVDVVLYVIGEGRYTTTNFQEAVIPFNSLSWDWGTLRSNYSDMRKAALADGAFLTTFARPNGLTSTIIAPDGLIADYGVTGGDSTQRYDNVADLYFAQAAAEDGVANDCEGVGAAIRGAAPGEVVVEGDNPDPGAISASAYACGGFTDLSTALVGMHPADVWVTRLEAALPREKLGTDLSLGASMPQAQADNWHVAATSIGSPCPATSSPATAPPPGDSAGGGCSVGTRRSPFSSIVVSGLSAAALLFAGRRAFGKRRR
ncbi:MAG: DUF2330 domain-containing protein [Byssovorax sp.]